MQNRPADAVIFGQLKPTCISLLGSARITPVNANLVSKLLSNLKDILADVEDPDLVLNTSLVEYIFFPISNIFQRNPVAAISDHILEKIFIIMNILCRNWWWDCSLSVWEQLVKLCGAVIGGLDIVTDRSGKPSEKGKGKGKERDEETREAAVICLHTLLSRPSDEAITRHRATSAQADQRYSLILEYATASPRFPMIGQILNSLLACANTELLSFKRHVLDVTKLLLEDFIPSTRTPQVLPGVVSTMCSVALGRKIGKGWQTGDAVSAALQVLGIAVIKSVGDADCRAAGLIKSAPSGLEDLLDVMTAQVESEEGQNPQPGGSDPFAFHRTSSWLQATTSQLLVAVNSLTPLLSHPTPSAQLAMSHLSSEILRSATTTLSSLHPLLISHLLTLILSPFELISRPSTSSLVSLLSPSSPASSNLLVVLLRLAQEDLGGLPSAILSDSDNKTEQIAQRIAAVCHLARDASLHRSARGSVATGIGKLLGQNGGIEKWGSRLLNVLELDPPSQSNVNVGSTNQLLLLDAFEGPPHEAPLFPPLAIKHITTPSTGAWLERMFHALGNVGGTEALFSVEWLYDLAKSGRGPLEVSAMWAATKLLEGISHTRLPQLASFASNVRQEPRSDEEPISGVARKKLEKAARSIVKSMAELWEMDPEEREELFEERSAEGDESADRTLAVLGDSALPTEFVKGLNQLTTLVDGGSQGSNGLGTSSSQTQRRAFHRRQMAVLHSALALNSISICASTLESQFSPLLIHALYPILRSLVSSHTVLRDTAVAALHHVTSASGYASPSNMLLSNFDYALDSVSRRLLRRRLDVKATKVLVLLVRLVGKDVVRRAGDVVEECFDRLDEFHGYGVVVEGLIAVLTEVVKVTEREDGGRSGVNAAAAVPAKANRDEDKFGQFLEWYQHRNDTAKEDSTDYGSAPREPWGPPKSTEDEGNDRDANARPVAEDDTPKSSPTQALVSQIIKRSLPFLTHTSPLIRSNILSLMRSSVVVLPPNEIQPSIHKAWPFILNRLKDSEPFVVSEAARLIDALSKNAGDFMSARVWDDVWPAYKKWLDALEEGDQANALAHRGRGGVGTATQYSTSHRLYLAMLGTLKSVFEAGTGLWIKDELVWEVTVKCRRFLAASAHPELQGVARGLYRNLSKRNEDLVWLVLTCTEDNGAEEDRLSWLPFLREDKWDMRGSVEDVLGWSTA